MPKKPFTPTPNDTALMNVALPYWKLVNDPATCLLMLPLMPLTLGMFFTINGYMAGRQMMGS